MTDLHDLPLGLPVPEDDGACRHLTGVPVPHIVLTSTADRGVNLGAVPGRVVVYCFPMLGTPGVPLPIGWNEIPGARGCTPQSCSFSDHHRELEALGALVFGMSSQSPKTQKAAVERLKLPFELLSDENFAASDALRLPCFEIAETSYIKRLTLVIDDARIQRVFYPIFPPDQHIHDVLAYLRGDFDEPRSEY